MLPSFQTWCLQNFINWLISSIPDWSRRQTSVCRWQQVKDLTTKGVLFSKTCLMWSILLPNLFCVILKDSGEAVEKWVVTRSLSPILTSECLSYCVCLTVFDSDWRWITQEKKGDKKDRWKILDGCWQVESVFLFSFVLFSSKNTPGSHCKKVFLRKVYNSLPRNLAHVFWGVGVWQL